MKTHFRFQTLVGPGYHEIKMKNPLAAAFEIHASNGFLEKFQVLPRRLDPPYHFPYLSLVGWEVYTEGRGLLDSLQNPTSLGSLQEYIPRLDTKPLGWQLPQKNGRKNFTPHLTEDSSAVRKFIVCIQRPPALKVFFFGLGWCCFGWDVGRNFKIKNHLLYCTRS